MARHLRITLGRGVQSLAMKRGGHIYVWAAGFGGDMERVKASSRQPEHLKFNHVENVGGVQVHLDDDVTTARRIVIRRYWWLPHQPFIVDTGTVLPGGPF